MLSLILGVIARTTIVWRTATAQSRSSNVFFYTIFIGNLLILVEAAKIALIDFVICSALTLRHGIGLNPILLQSTQTSLACKWYR